jgi:hypothetical protein
MIATIIALLLQLSIIQTENEWHQMNDQQQKAHVDYLIGQDLINQ